MVQNKVQGTLGRVWGHSVVRVSDTYFLAVCNCGFTNTQRSSLFKRQITRLLVNPYLVFTTRYMYCHGHRLIIFAPGNFPSEIETRSLSFSTLLVWRSHICITSLTALRFFD